MSVAGATRLCIEQLRQLATSESTTGTWAENQKARINFWAATIGVFESGRLSLSCHLQLNDEMSYILVEVLGGLQACLKEYEILRA